MKISPFLNMRKYAFTCLKINSLVNTGVSKLFQHFIKTSTLPLKGLNLIKKSNVFIFKDKYFKQQKGAPMGSPISSILAEFKLRPLEELIFKKHFPKPTYDTHLRRLRYVDDIFVIWEDGKQSLENFFDEINQLDNNIKFTMELENNNSLPFLDVLLVKPFRRSVPRSGYLILIPNLRSAPRIF